MPKFVKVIEMTDAIIELIASGFGVGILSRWALEPALENNRVVALRVSPDGLDYVGQPLFVRDNTKIHRRER